MHRRAWDKLGAAACLLLCPALAAAEPAAASPRREQRDTWYGWQTLSADGAALTLGAAGIASGAAAGSGELMATAVLLGGASFVLTTPILHASHGRAGRGVASFAMRSGGMFVSAVTGVALYTGIACNTSSTACAGELGGLDENLIGGGLGLGIGALTSIAIDAAALAWEPEPATAEPASQAAVRWSPTGAYDPQRALATVGVQGAF